MLTPRERDRLIKQLWSKKHRDFRSTRGDETHPSILAWGPRGTTLVPLRGATDEELIALRDTGGLPGVGRRALPGPRAFQHTEGQAFTSSGGQRITYKYAYGPISEAEARRELLRGQPLPGSKNAPTFHGIPVAISLRGTGAWLLPLAGPGYLIVATTEGDVARAGGHVAPGLWDDRPPGRRSTGSAPTYVKRYGVDKPVTVTSKWAEFQPGDAVFVGYRGHGIVLSRPPATKHEPAAIRIAWQDGTSDSWAQVGSALLERDLVKLSKPAGAAARRFPKGGPCGQYKTAPAREKCRARVGAKIGKLLDEGISQPQAVATALSMEAAGRLGPRGGYQKVGSRATSKPLVPGAWNVYAGGLLKNAEAPFSPGTLSPYNGNLASVDIRPPGESTYSPWMVQLRALIGRGWGQMKFASAKNKAAATRLAAQWTKKYLET